MDTICERTSEAVKSRERVLGLPELCADILQWLPEEDLVKRANRVSRTFRYAAAAVTANYRERREPSEQAQTGYELNPVLQRHLPAWFFEYLPGLAGSNDRVAHFLHASQFHSQEKQSAPARTRLAGLPLWRHMQVERDERYGQTSAALTARDGFSNSDGNLLLAGFLPDCDRDKTPHYFPSAAANTWRQKAAKHAWLHPAATWRRMHVANRPVYRLSLHLYVMSASLEVGKATYTIAELAFPNGLRAGDLMDLAIVLSHKSCKFRLFWPTTHMDASYREMVPWRSGLLDLPRQLRDFQRGCLVLDVTYVQNEHRQQTLLTQAALVAVQALVEKHVVSEEQCHHYGAGHEHGGSPLNRWISSSDEDVRTGVAAKKVAELIC